MNDPAGTLRRSGRAGSGAVADGFEAANEGAVPALRMGRDEDILVPEGSGQRLFDAFAPDVRSYASLPKGRHLSFIDRCSGCTNALPEAHAHELIRRYVTAFLMVNVRGDPRYEDFLSSDPPDAVWVER